MKWSLGFSSFSRICGRCRDTVLKVDDYGKIVPVKMDLDTVKGKHKNHRYPTVEAFFAEIFVVYTNASTYYERGGAHRNKLIYDAAKVSIIWNALFSDHLISKYEREAVDLDAVIAT